MSKKYPPPPQVEEAPSLQRVNPTLLENLLEMALKGSGAPEGLLIISTPNGDALYSAKLSPEGMSHMPKNLMDIALQLGKKAQENDKTIPV